MNEPTATQGKITKHKRSGRVVFRAKIERRTEKQEGGVRGALGMKRKTKRNAGARQATSTPVHASRGKL